METSRRHDITSNTEEEKRGKDEADIEADRKDKERS